MLKLIFFAGLVSTSFAFQCGDVQLEKLGCFKRDANLFKDMLSNNRDVNSNHFTGSVIDWNNFETSLQSLACDCAAKATSQGYIAIALGFYGECHATKDAVSFDTLKSTPSSRSNACVNHGYASCQSSDQQCVGQANAEYIYIFPSKAPEKIDGGYSEWSDYTDCSASCGDGAQYRERACVNPAPKNGGSGCEALGGATESKACKIKECPIDGKYGIWSSYSTCSKSCGGGSQKRTRKCNSPAPAHGGASCVGSAEQSQNCKTQACPVNGKYGSWSSYSTCSKSCGGGSQKRTRKCNSPAPAHGGANCVGSAEQSQNCKTQACPVNGKYGSWSSYSTCSKSCGGGSQKRTRKCNSPAPAHGGASCVGSAEQSQNCKTQACPVNGKYGSWSSYSTCSKSCGGGSQKRTRKCNSPAPAHGGASCVGFAEQSQICKTEGCPVNGKYGAWSAYSSCSKSCGSGQMTKTRHCNSPSQANGGLPCAGPSSNTEQCNTQPCLKSTYCYTTNTGFQDDGDGDAVYLDRHTLHCAAGYLINYVKLERNSGHNKIKYTYKCCKSQLSCSDSTTTNGRSYNGGGQGNSVYLDRQSIQCYNKGLSYLKLDRSGNYWNYKYDCCKVSYVSSSVYCYSKSTGFANDGDGESVYLDRHTISCDSQTDFVTYMKMSRNSGHDKVKYDYKCCRINTPSRTN